jgi:hypothetical protein
MMVLTELDERSLIALRPDWTLSNVNKRMLSELILQHATQ